MDFVRCGFCHKPLIECLIKEHYLTCEYKLVDCENECGMKLYQYLQKQHQSKECINKRIICRYCSQNCIAKCIDDHNKVCPKMIINCPYECDVTDLIREQLKIHLETVCSVATKPCPFENINCIFRGTEKALENHLEEECADHLELLEEVVKEQNKLIQAQNSIVSLMNTRLAFIESRFEGVMEGQSGKFIWKIDDWSEKRKSAKFGDVTEFYSPEFYSSQYGYKMKLQIKPNGDGEFTGTHVSLQIFIINGDYDGILYWPFEQRVTFTLLNQTTNRLSENITRSFTTTTIPGSPESWKRPGKVANPGYGFTDFVLQSLINNGQFNQHNIVYIKVEIDQ